jgi:cytochrome c biogenesis protein CcdA/glutaredoxin
LPQLYKQYGQQLQIKAIDINADEANYQWLIACEKQYQVPEDKVSVPALFIDDKYLIGSADISSQLPSLIERYLENGGVDFPDVPRPGGPLAPTVRFGFFYSPTCPHCIYVEEQVFPKIRAKYGDQVLWEAYDTSEEGNYRALLTLGELAGLPEKVRGSVPVLFVGDESTLYTLLFGSDQIEAYLDSAIEWFVAVGGVGFPAWWREMFPTTPETQPSPSATTEKDKPIHMAYFAEAGCNECDRVSIALQHLKERFPSLVIHELDILQDVEINLCLGEALQVPENQRHDAPAIFVGSDYLVDKDIQYDKLIEIVSRYVETGAEPTWEACEGKNVELPSLPPWWIVIAYGLVDGINPCAFATIIFFVSYLSFIERKGRDILIVGIAYTLAVFLSYLGFGMLLRQALSGLIDLVGSILRPILNTLMAVFCLVLAILSFSDFFKARRGKVKAMSLRLPDKLRRWINATIRSSMKSETLDRLVVASFVSGAVVSFIELTCTGPWYVPIILGVSTPEYRTRSLLTLVVYCLCFIVPLVVVFVASYLGTSSRQLGALLQRHTATVKLITAIGFLGIGLWLVYDMLRVWGVVSPWIASALG